MPLLGNVVAREFALKILFVNVSKNWNGRVYPEYPIGIGILATMARDAGHEIKIFDMAVTDASLAEAVTAFSPDVTALSFLSTSATTAAEAIGLLRGVDSGILVAGGIHTSIFLLMC